MQNGTKPQGNSDDADSRAVMAELSACEQPFLIGVRHHSAAMARTMPQLLQQFSPERILLELPPEFSEWLSWLGHDQTVAPVALAGCRSDGADLCFYPFADFSPELAAIRWGIANGIPIELIDLPVAERETEFVREVVEPRGLLQHLMRRTGSDDVGKLWDKLVESPAAASGPEQIRRAALLFGWALRWNDGAPSGHDQRREQFMRSRIEATAGSRCAAVIGAYHAAALLPVPRLVAKSAQPGEQSAQTGEQSAQTGAKSSTAKTATAGAAEDTQTKVATALIPYGFEQLDERSGYPAGIRDPMWHQRVFEADSADALDRAMVDLVVGVCRELRQAGHPMNAADAMEVVRICRDLARVRNFAVPGRQEVIEAMQLCLTQGQLYGAGRSVAAAMQTVLVGHRSGTLPDSLPRCGLAPHVEDVLQRLRLPGPEALGQEKRLRLDPLRSALDRAREVTFHRFGVCQIRYALPADDGSAADRESLTTVWTVKWENTTAAMIALSSTRGATLQQAAEGFVRKPLSAPQAEWGVAQLMTFQQAAHCGFGDLVRIGLDWIQDAFSNTATLAELTVGMSFVDRVVRGHFPGLPGSDDSFLPEFCRAFVVPKGLTSAGLLQSAIARIDGIRGSEDEGDAAALLDLLLWFQQQDDETVSVDASRLLWSLRALARKGSPLMQGAGTSSLYLLNQISTEEFSHRSGSWLDNASTPDTRRGLYLRLRGALRIVQARLHSAVDCLNGLDERIDELNDRDFMHRLPALRRGFDVLSPGSRLSLLRLLQDRWPEQSVLQRPAKDDPEHQRLWFQADEAARAAVAELMPDLELISDLSDASEAVPASRKPSEVNREVSQLDRWRLILGSRSESMSPSARTAARALDELYGHGSGEGARGGIAGPRGGDEAPYPNVREWAEDLQDLFGENVREEVLAEAVEQGRAAALTMLDEDSVRPSVELLEQLLSMKGGLPESQMEKLRRMAKRISEQLAQELATCMAPALMGLSTPRPTRRPSRRLNLRRTILSNLHTARRDEDGRIQLSPEHFFFHTSAKRSMDWHIIYVVDVSGSMEPSVIYSALTAAVFSALPALSVSFLAFSTEVVDFTNRVDDPLAMLMEVQVGGGTNISSGMQAARERMKVPSRTIVLLITDFEEGGSVGRLLSEVRALVDTGAKALGLAALSDDGKPRYHTGIAGQVAGCGMPVAALSPQQLARWVGEQIR